MAISADQELNTEGTKNVNQSYQEQVEEKTSGKEGELVSLRDIMGKVGPLKNMLDACQNFPHIEANKRLFERLKRVFSDKGLGEARQDMMILAEDEETVKELLGEVTEELISEISSEVNGLVLNSNGTMDPDQSREQGRIFNELHPDNQIDVGNYDIEQIDEKVEKMINGEKYKGTLKENNEFSDSEKLSFAIEELLADISPEDFFSSYKAFESGEEGVKILDTEETENVSRELAEAAKENTEIVDAFRKAQEDKMFIHVINLVKNLESKGLLKPPLNVRGLVALYIQFDEARTDLMEGKLKSLSPEERDKMVRKELFESLPDFIDKAREEQEEFLAKRGVEASIKDSDELLQYQFLSLTINARKALNSNPKNSMEKKEIAYHLAKYKEFMNYYGDRFKNVKKDKNDIAILSEEEENTFYKKEKSYMIYKIAKDLPKSYSFDKLDSKEKIKVLKRYVQGFYLFDEAGDEGAKFAYLEAIERCLGSDAVNMDMLEINDESFVQKYIELGGGKAKDSKEVFNIALSENKHSFSRFLTDRESDYRDGFFVNLKINKDATNREALKLLEVAGDERQDDYFEHLKSLDYPRTYNEAMKISFISNLMVGDFQSNERLLKKEPELAKLCVKRRPTKEAKEIYDKAFNEQIKVELEKFEGSDGNKIPHDDFRRKQLLELIALGANSKDELIAKKSIELLEQMDPSCVSRTKLLTKGINYKVFNKYYRTLEERTQTGNSQKENDGKNDNGKTEIQRIRDLAQKHFQSTYDMKFGKIRQSFVNMLEEGVRDDESLDDLKELDIADLIERHQEVEQQRIKEGIEEEKERTDAQPLLEEAIRKGSSEILETIEKIEENERAIIIESEPKEEEQAESDKKKPRKYKSQKKSKIIEEALEKSQRLSGRQRRKLLRAAKARARVERKIKNNSNYKAQSENTEEKSSQILGESAEDNEKRIADADLLMIAGEDMEVVDVAEIVEARRLLSDGEFEKMGGEATVLIAAKTVVPADLHSKLAEMKTVDINVGEKPPEKGTEAEHLAEETEKKDIVTQNKKEEELGR